MWRRRWSQGAGGVSPRCRVGMNLRNYCELYNNFHKNATSTLEQQTSINYQLSTLEEYLVKNFIHQDLKIGQMFVLEAGKIFLPLSNGALNCSVFN